MIEIKLLPEAEHDVASAALWYEHHLPERRAEFLRAYRATVEHAVRLPHSGSPIRDIKAPFVVRRFWFSGFPYALMAGFQALAQAPRQSLALALAKLPALILVFSS
jgi:plasmid stabilization system protein ParE